RQSSVWKSGSRSGTAFCCRRLNWRNFSTGRLEASDIASATHRISRPGSSAPAAVVSAGVCITRPPTSRGSSPPQFRVTDNTIIRAPRRRRFVVVDQTVVDDDRLTLAARGLLVMLLSRPDDWRIRISDLRKRCHVGRDAVYKLLRELRKLGYVRYVPSRTP